MLTQRSGDLPFQVSTSASTVYVISLHGTAKAGYKIRIISLDPLSGKQTERHTLSSEAEISGPDSILFVGANVASPVIAWADNKMRSLKVNIIGSKHINSFAIPNEHGESIRRVSLHAPHLIKSLPHFLVHYQGEESHWAEVYHIDLTASTISKAYELPKVAGRGTFSTSNQDANVYFTRNTEAEVILVSSASHGVLGRWPTLLPLENSPTGGLKRGIPVHAVSEVIALTGNTYAVRSALLLATGDWLLIKNGERAWLRAEALAGAVAANWAEVNPAENLAENLKAEGDYNLLMAYISRIRRHIRDIRGLLKTLEWPSVGTSVPFVRLPTTKTQRKDKHGVKFGFQKYVIVATDSGRLYALDAGDQGLIVWATQAATLKPGETWNVKAILVENTKARVSVKGSAGDLVMVDIETGKILSTSPPRSSPTVESTAIVESKSGKHLLEIDEDGNPGNLSSDQAPLGQEVLIVRGKKGILKGLKFLPKGSLIHPVTAWEFAPASGERVALLTSRPSHDPVASIGRVLGDRSVMYKYLNPNLLLVTVANDKAATATFHLLDSVSGRIIHSATQAGVDTSRSITAAMSENWIIYSFWGDIPSSNTSPSALKGYQLVVAELYESMSPNDRGPLGNAANFSSLYPSLGDADPEQPYVISQSFFVPEEISSLAITQTRQGITSRSILATLPFSNAIISIPKALVDPRRPVGRDPTPAEMEEGLMRRTPVLEFDPKWIISHKREVMGVEKIITTPALLESTSLVFAFGLDIFGTRVAPSMAFDILGREFAKWQLILTVLALGAGVMVLAPMVSYITMR